MLDKRKRKSMENLDKCYNVVQQSSTKGVAAIEIAKKLGVHRTTVHGYLNSLELMGKVHSEHGLWFAEEPHAKLKIGIPNYLVERFWREEEEIEKANLLGESGTAYRQARLLWLKFPSSYKQKLLPAFEKVDGRLKSITAESHDFYSRELKKLRYLRDVGIPFLVERFSLVLHEMEGEKNG